MKNKQIAQILLDSCPKNYQNTLIFMIFARKIPLFYIFYPKMPEFYIKFAQKYFSPNFRGAPHVLLPRPGPSKATEGPGRHYRGGHGALSSPFCMSWDRDAEGVKREETWGGCPLAIGLGVQGVS